ncbi:ABC transporter ATP-binding protein [Neobacillus drentensis]|uniref:ABC transporter ATP-binding protein n=1 Tax=Neobacillus drentensis TaxID=220684 RepID=UPI002861130D|nr:dipeptide ABC transporter ATP-binding protein [Neobacillus drentensis]MDR7238079.1 oligopeptide/dipeptide ABC transporter ATP-binding protein [Neobacillus drentensis]
MELQLVTRAEQTEKEILLEVKGLTKYFPIKGGLLSKTKGWVKSLDNVSFTIKKGESLGVVGESGCGKSTLGRTLLRLLEPTKGEVYYQGENVFALDKGEVRKIRRKMQMIFQDPYSSLNPRMKIGTILEEPLRLFNLGSEDERKKRIDDLMKIVGLDSDYLNRFPHELSGGQRQRIGIARALLLNPEFIVCDEAVSALDVSIQSQIINLLQDLQEQFNLTYFFIAHDLSVVKHISDRIAVMYLGEIVELTDKKSIFEQPLHPYTESLLSAIPIANPEIQRKRKRIVLQGDVPNPDNPPTGCRFHTRCPYTQEICKSKKPAFNNVNEGDSSKPEHFVACHFANELTLNGVEGIV